MEKSSSKLWELLGALYQNGTNKEKLLELLPDWTSQEISSTIKRYRGKAARQMALARLNRPKAAPIDMWYNFLDKCHMLEGTSKHVVKWNKGYSTKSKKRPPSDNYSHLLSKVFMHGACFEEHYQGLTPDEPNYNEIYRYLAQLLAGEEPAQLRPGSAAKVLEMLSMVKEIISNSSNIKDYQKYFEKMDMSYLSESTTPSGAIEQRRKRRKKEDPSSSSCLLFEEEEAECCLSELDTDSPSYEVKRDAILMKLCQQQCASAEVLAEIPGLNPLEFKANLLVKPPVALTNFTNTDSKVSPDKKIVEES